MSAYPTRLVTSSAILCSALFAFCASVPATEITLQRVPGLTVEQAPAYPENVARYHSGATVEVASPNSAASALELSSKAKDTNTAEAALLCDDPTVGYALAQGQSSLVVSLSKIENLDTLSFLNRGAKGQLTVSVSDTKIPAASGQWRKVSHQDLTSDAMKLKVGPSDAKYVKLSFDLSEPGRISSLGIYATPSVSAFTAPRARKFTSQDEGIALISYNLTDVHAKARALYVSSGDEMKRANNMIDDQPATTFSFSPDDATPTAIIDLGKVMTLRRIATVYSARQGNVDFFVTSTLPERAQNKGKTLRLDDSAFSDMQMVGSVADGSGRASIDFPETAGRYIVVRWTPVGQQGAGFAVSEVAAFGDSNKGGLFAANTSYGAIDGVESDGKSVMDGKDAKDLGEGKDIPAEAPAEGPAPSLPEPPPFVFVPVTVPISP